MPYVSTLNKICPDKIVTMADFNRPEGGILCDPKGANSLLAYWNDHVPYRPQELSKIFEDAVGGQKCNISVSLEYQGFWKKKVLASFIIFRDDDKHGLKQVYDLSLPLPILLESYITLTKDQQSRGFGRELTKRSMELDIALGVQEFQCDASLEVGGYVWAKAGYYLDVFSRSKKLSKEMLSQTLRVKLEVLKGKIPDEVFNEVKELCCLGNEDDLYHIAWLDHPVDIGENDLSKLEHFPEEKLNIRKVSAFCGERNIPLTLGKFLLVGEEWCAKVIIIPTRIKWIVSRPIQARWNIVCGKMM